MIKPLKQYQIQLTPFAATKNWNVGNSVNNNLVLLENGLAICLEFIDYNDGYGYPYDNDVCDIALEQQDNDVAKLEMGQYVGGTFYPDVDPKNPDGTYLRSIYYQIRTTFYNNYRNPTQLWGMENIDFELSQTKRNLADQFRLLSLPQLTFGDKIVPNSIVITDNSYDNEYTITDDGNCNLFAGTNLFSNQQELGEYNNTFQEGTSSYCDYYFIDHTPVHAESVAVAVAFHSGSLVNELRSDFMGTSIGFLFGSTQNQVLFDYPTVNMRFGSGFITQSAIVVTVTGSISEFPNITLGFYTGSTSDTVQVVTASFDTALISMAFFSGSSSITTTVVTASIESMGASVGFYTGSQIVTTFPQTMSFNQVATSVGFYGGTIN